MIDEDVASIILAACYRSARELTELLPIIKEHCEERDYAALSAAISGVVFDLMQEVGTYASTESPGLSSKVESRLARLGRAF